MFRATDSGIWACTGKWSWLHRFWNLSYGEKEAFVCQAPCETEQQVSAGEAVRACLLLKKSMRSCVTLL